MREPVKDPGRLKHILAAISQVEEYTAGLTREQFCADKLRIHATAYNIQIIGEACYRLTKEFKDLHPETPWRLIEKMRHILVHDYFAVDLDFVWMVIDEDIPVLKPQVEAYLKEFEI
ncbi:MAG: DUF86 domain-containing protein [Bacteroidaceae bacterium]|nr:DUF86 domain-containing protein [Bacteroidaceae bacterium]